MGDLGQVASDSEPTKELPSFHHNQPLENLQLTLKCTSPPTAITKQYIWNEVNEKSFWVPVLEMWVCLSHTGAAENPELCCMNMGQSRPSPTVLREFYTLSFPQPGASGSQDVTLQWHSNSPWQSFFEEKAHAVQNIPVGYTWPAAPIFLSTVPHQTRICLRRLPSQAFSLLDILKIFFKETQNYICVEKIATPQAQQLLYIHSALIP